MTERIRFIGEVSVQPETPEVAPTEFRSLHDKRWDDLGPDDAPRARQALARAQELRTSGADAGDAYLEGWMERHTIEQGKTEHKTAV